MATFKYYDGTKYNRITCGLVPKTTRTTSDTETYSCNYVNSQVDDLNTTIIGVDSIVAKKPNAINTYTTSATDAYTCEYINANTIPVINFSGDFNDYKETAISHSHISVGGSLADI